MSWPNLTADTYKTAERDFRCAFEAYMGIDDAEKMMEKMMPDLA